MFENTLENISDFFCSVFHAMPQSISNSNINSNTNLQYSSHGSSSNSNAHTHTHAVEQAFVMSVDDRENCRHDTGRRFTDPTRIQDSDGDLMVGGGTDVGQAPSHGHTGW